MVRYYAIWATVLCSLSATLAASDLTEEKFQQLHAELQQDKSAAWRTIPWQTSLLEAQRIAVERKQPLFIWAMDGHPLGCT